MNKSENYTEQIKKTVLVVGGAFLFIFLIAKLGQESNNNSSSGQISSQSNTISNVSDAKDCIQHKTFRNTTVAGEISFTSDQFSYISGRPADTNLGFYEVNSRSAIRLIRNYGNSQLPANISLIDCYTLSISGRNFTR